MIHTILFCYFKQKMFPDSYKQLNFGTFQLDAITIYDVDQLLINNIIFLLRHSLRAV